MCIAYLLMHLYSWLYSYAQQHHLLYSLDFNLHALVSSITIIIILILRKVFLVISWNAFSSGHLVSLKLVNFHHWYIDGGGLWLGTKKKHGKCQWSKDTTTSLCMCGLQKMPMQDYCPCRTIIIMYRWLDRLHLTQTAVSLADSYDARVHLKNHTFIDHFALCYMLHVML